MKSMPPLRTARESDHSDAPAAGIPLRGPTPPTAAPPESGVRKSGVISPTRSGRVPNPPRPHTGLDHPRLPAVARTFLNDLVSYGLLPPADLTRFLHIVGDRIAGLTIRDRVGDALVHFGFLTEYQRMRAVSGQLFGTVFGSYRVLDRLGGGTVGVVFLGEHTFLKRKVAIKVLADTGEQDDPVRIERFVNEAYSLACLNHPYVVAVFDAGVIRSGNESQWYLVLEPVMGGDLENYLYANGPQPTERVAAWGWQAALGLHAAHLAGLIHRDVKPSNMLLTESGHLKVADFGLVRRYDASLTGHRSIIGSLEFLAPEQLNDPTTAGPPADVYGLAVSLFWALTGKLPYPEGLRPSELVAHLRTHQPLRLREVNARQPAELDDLFARMMARNPGDRPTLPAVAAALSTIAAPTNHPDVAAQLFIPDDTNEAEAARFAVRELETLVQTQTAQMSDLRDAVLNGLKAAVVRHPGETAGHVQRVAAYSRVLARQLSGKEQWSGFQNKAAESELARAATLHDLGLLGISDSIDCGAVSRTPSEEHEYRTHPMLGTQMLGELADRHGQLLPYLRMLRDVVRHHHERWDGTGWPDALQGMNIPQAARIVAVADAYDRLRAPGSDKRGMGHDDAVSAITRESGTKFDPDVIAAFKDVAAPIGEIFAVIPDDPNATAATKPHQGG